MRKRNSNSTVRLLAFHHFALPWRPWQGLTIGEACADNPDVIFAIEDHGRRGCTPMLWRAIRVAATLRRLEIGRTGGRKRRSA